tara:strand:- start:401 stop:1567 length:1167 start_codon:yes stop_codon:yes gene_type:complete
MKKILSIIVLSIFVVPFVGIGGVAIAALIPAMSGVAYMGLIPVVQGQNLFTSNLIGVYKEKVSVSGFLSSFFTKKESFTKYLNIAVSRGLESVAVDVNRYSDGNRNTFSVETQKEFLPPFYDEYLTANEHKLYDTVIAMLANGDTTFFAQMTQELAENVMKLQQKIERAIEIQCSQIFETGVITLLNGDDIDFKRKAASIVAYNVANDFSVGTVSPYKVLEAGCDFIRTKGKVGTGTFNAILGSEALTALLENTIVQNRNDIKDFSLDMISEPQRNSEGAALHGVLSCGSYKVRLWTYPQNYDNASAVSTPYINPKKVVLLPEQTDFILGFAAVPQLINEAGGIPQKGAYLVQDFRDEKRGSHEIHVKSAPLPIPLAIDTIYTVAVLN